MEIPSRHLRRRRKVAPSEFLDEQEQESLVEKFTEQANAQARLYRILFAIVLVIPSPTYIFASHCRAHAKLAFLSLVSLITSIYSVRSNAAKVPLLRRLNLALACLVVTQAWLNLRNAVISRADIVWLFPLMAALTSLLLDRWLCQVQVEIKRLSDARYELRGV